MFLYYEKLDLLIIHLLLISAAGSESEFQMHMTSGNRPQHTRRAQVPAASSGRVPY